METKRYKLSEISLNVTDGEHGTIKDDNNGKYYLLSCKNIKNGLINITSNERIINEESFNKVQKRIRLEKNDVLITTVGTIGEMAIIETNDINYCFQRSVGIIKPNIEIVNPYYLYYSLKNETKQISTLIKGAVQKCLFINDMKMIEIDLPNMKIQNKIVKILNNIDKKIKLNNEINNNLYEIGKELVRSCEIENDTTVELMDVMKFINGFAFKNSDYDENGKYKIITIKNVQDGYIDSIKTDRIVGIPEKMKKECILNIGDVLLSLTGNVGRVGIVYEENMLLNQRVAKFEPYKKEFLPYLYFKFLNSTMREQLENISKGTAQQNLSTVETLKLKINYNNSRLKSIIPTLNAIFNKIINNKIEEKKLIELRDTLLPKLMNGEVDLDNIEV